MPNLDEIYEGIRKADANGDVEGVKRLGEYLQSIKDTPAAEEPKQPVVDTTKPQTTKPKKLTTAVEGAIQGLAGTANVLRGVPAAVGNMATGAIAAPVAGLAGIGSTIKNLAQGRSFDDAASAGADTSEAIQHKLTYEPKTESGKAAVSAANLPMEVASELLGKGGGAIGSVIGPRSEAAGEIIGKNAIPLAMTAEGLRGAVMNPMKPKEAVPGRNFSPLRKLNPEQENRFFRMKDQGVEPTLGNVTREPSQVRFEQQTAPTRDGAPIDQRMREQDHALADHINTLKKGPGMAGARDVNVTEAGRGVRVAVEKKAAAKKLQIKEAYDEARASGETKELVPVNALARYLKENESATVAVPELKAIANHLAELQEMTGTDAKMVPGKGTPINPGEISMEQPKAAGTQGLQAVGKVSIDDLEFLRQQAGKLANKEGSAKNYMVDVIKTIDRMTEGRGGEKYKAARAKRREYAVEFEDNAGVANIIDRKPATPADYKVATEDVWNKTVVSGSVADLGNVLNSLRSTRGAERQGAVQAMKDLQAHTVDHILEKAHVDGNISPAQLRKVINDIGKDKVDLLLGRDAMAKLQASLQTAKDLKTSPRKVPGSDTKLNAKRDIEEQAAKHAESVIKGVLPVWAGRLMSNFTENYRARAETRATKAAVEESLTPRRASMADIQKQADQVKADRSKYVKGEVAKRSAGPAVATMKDENKKRDVLTLD